MIIKLTEADFSGNNIGRIDIPIDFDDTTKNVLSMFAIVENTSNAVQYALNTFVVSLKNANLWGTKIKSLCLPFLSELSQSGALRYAIKNVVDGTPFFTTDVDGSLLLSDHGLACVENGNVVRAYLAKYCSESYHLSGYNTTEEIIEVSATSTQKYNRYIFGVNGYTTGLMKYNNTYSAPAFLTPTLAAAPSDYRKIPCLVIGNVKNTGETTIDMSISVNGVVKSLEGQTKKGSAITEDVRFGVYDRSAYQENVGYNYSYTKASWGLLSIGDALTDEECVIYTDAVNALMEVVRTM